MSELDPAPDTLVFPATLSAAARFFSHAFMVLFSCAGFVLLSLGVHQLQRTGIGGPGGPMLIGAVALGVVLPLCVLMAPRGYAVSPQGIEVLRHWPRTLLAADNIAAVEAIELRRFRKVCGFSGVYGAWGWFGSDKLTWFRAYVTRRNSLAVIRLRKGHPVVVSPDDLAQFLEAAQLLLSPAVKRSPRGPLGIL
jgi:hypothetical protein